MLLVFIRRWEIQTKLHRLFFCKVSYTTYDVPWCVEWMHFRMSDELERIWKEAVMA
jgi:hypothetical protein